MRAQKPFELLVWNVRSRFNVGAMFRTADAVGITKMHLCGYTPAPPHSRIEKVSLGAEKSVPFTQHKTIVPTLKKLKKRGFLICAIEQTTTSIPYHTFKAPDKPLALIVGNELDGVSQAALSLCDHHLKIPMQGMKESLNVAISFAIVAYRLAFP